MQEVLGETTVTYMRNYIFLQDYTHLQVMGRQTVSLIFAGRGSGFPMCAVRSRAGVQPTPVAIVNVRVGRDIVVSVSDRNSDNDCSLLCSGVCCR